MTELKKFVRIKARYEGRCAETDCRAPIQVGDDIIYNTETHKTYCIDCGSTYMEIEEEA